MHSGITYRSGSKWRYAHALAEEPHGRIRQNAGPCRVMQTE